MAVRAASFPETVIIPRTDWVTVDHRALAETVPQENSTILHLDYTPDAGFNTVPEDNRLTGYTYSPNPGFIYRMAAGPLGLTLEQEGSTAPLSVDATTDEWGSRFLWLRDGRPIAVTLVHVRPVGPWSDQSTYSRLYLEVFGSGADISSGQIRDLVLRRWPEFSYHDGGSTNNMGDDDLIVDISLDVQLGDTLRYSRQVGFGPWQPTGVYRGSWHRDTRGGEGGDVTWLHSSNKSGRDVISSNHLFLPS